MEGEQNVDQIEQNEQNGEIVDQNEQDTQLFHYMPAEQVIGEINNDLICFICFGVSYKPIYLKCCEHLICLDCVKQYLRQYKKCPLCKASIKFDRPSRIITRLFEKILFQCPSCSIGVEYKNYFLHMINCNEELKNLGFCKSCERLYIEGTHDCNIIEYGNHNYNPMEAKFFQFLGKKRLLPKGSPQGGGVFEPVLHKHRLVFTNIRYETGYIRVGWECDYCNTRYDKNKGSYFCNECSIDICQGCYDKYVNNKEKFIHRHELTALSKYDWKCKVCKKFYEYRISFTCDGCNIDACLNCYIKN
jgi:hypothetical protein